MEVLRKLFSEIKLLGDFIREMDSSEHLTEVLVSENDTDSYKAFLDQTLVCSLSGARLPKIQNFKQTSEQSEIVHSIIRKLKKKERTQKSRKNEHTERLMKKERTQRNLLVLGYEIESENPEAQVSTKYGLVFTHFNQNASALQNPTWKTLLSSLTYELFYVLNPWSFWGIGDEAMIILLETQSIFLQAPAGCYIQVTGVPVFDLWPFQNGVSLDVKKPHQHSEKSTTRKDFLKFIFPSQKKRTKRKVMLSIKVGATSEDHSEENSRTNVINARASRLARQRMNTKRKRTSSSCENDTPKKKQKTTQEQVLGVINSAESRVQGKGGCLTTVSLPFRGKDFTDVTKTMQVELQKRDTSSTSRKDVYGTKKRRRKKRKKTKDPPTDSDLTSIQRISYHTPVDRSRIFFAKDLREKLPRTFILNNLQGDENGAQQVLNQMMSQSKLLDTAGDQVLKESTCAEEAGTNDVIIRDKTRDKLLEFVKHIIIKHRKCPYRVILNNQARQTKNIEDHYSNKQVYLFLRTCLLAVLPSELFGSSANRIRLFKVVQKFLNLGRYEKLYLGEVMHKVKAGDCTWLKGEPNKEAVLAHVYYWVMSRFVGSLLKAFFYITDTSTFRNKMFYIRKFTWSEVQKETIKGLEEKCLLTAISKKEAEEKVKDALGVCYMRFLPKARGLRPISNLSRKPPPSSDKEISINKQLMEVFHVLNLAKDLNPRLLGSSKLGLDDICTSWRKFVCSRNAGNDQRPLYFVKLDLQACYDSINEQKLFKIIENILKQIKEECILRRYATVMISGGRLKRKFHLDVNCLSRHTPRFVHFVKKLTECNNLRNAVAIDQGFCYWNLVQDLFFWSAVYHKDIRSEVLEKLKAHLKNNIVQAGGHYYLQKQGICQGSVVSTLLCLFYYGVMERQYLPSVLEGEEILMRQVDDFLYVTPYIDRARTFADILLKGIPEFNCTVNEAKTLTNFKIPNHPLAVQIKENAWLPWCGIIFHTKTLEVSVDYSRYTKINIGDTLSFDGGHKPGETLKYKMLRWMRPKCHNIFLDDHVNSVGTIYRNVYELFLLSAAKLHYCITRLPSTHRAQQNPAFFFKVILNLPYYLRCQVSIKAKQLGTSNEMIIQLAELKWLCLQAFRKKLERKRAQYMSLLKGIRKLIKSAERKLRPELLERMKTSVAMTSVVFNIFHDQ